MGTPPPARDRQRKHRRLRSGIAKKKGGPFKQSTQNALFCPSGGLFIR